MGPQVDKAVFRQALVELGHDPTSYEGKRLSFHGMCELYELDTLKIFKTLDERSISAIVIGCFSLSLSQAVL